MVFDPFNQWGIPPRNTNQSLMNIMRLMSAPRAQQFGGPINYGYGPEQQFFENNSLFGSPMGETGPRVGSPFIARPMGGAGPVSITAGIGGRGGGGRAGYEPSAPGASTANMSVRELREMRDRLSGFAGWGKSPMTAFGKGLASLAMPAYGLARLGAYGMSKAIQSEIDKRPPGYAGAVSGRTGFEGSPEMGGRRGGGRSGERGGGGKSERDLDRESRAATGERTSQRGGMGGL